MTTGVSSKTISADSREYRRLVAQRPPALTFADSKRVAEALVGQIDASLPDYVRVEMVAHLASKLYWDWPSTVLRGLKAEVEREVAGE